MNNCRHKCALLRTLLGNRDVSLWPSDKVKYHSTTLVSLTMAFYLLPERGFVIFSKILSIETPPPRPTQVEEHLRIHIFIVNSEL